MQTRKKNEICDRLTITLAYDTNFPNGNGWLLYLAGINCPSANLFNIFIEFIYALHACNLMLVPFSSFGYIRPFMLVSFLSQLIDHWNSNIKWMGFFSVVVVVVFIFSTLRLRSILGRWPFSHHLLTPSLDACYPICFVFGCAVECPRRAARHEIPF